MYSTKYVCWEQVEQIKHWNDLIRSSESRKCHRAAPTNIRRWNGMSRLLRRKHSIECRRPGVCVTPCDSILANSFSMCLHPAEHLHQTNKYDLIRNIYLFASHYTRCR